ncbi:MULTISPECIES: pyridoxamine 5'-phosphate oxidase family protein [unclassified Saccharopolyspora]|uniref:pyridoxamine 5'-phosphate oxidase family protein n=1 Tax=unclassified Saccharopolyspora TaxID=2646250 RepID=UPI001CD687AA|nr:MULTISPECIES: pyridoxamine 5'-phosphate oxidase family protein [unclassified Saccharopolyspora]MCA1192822.1 pyridoxamine 5'-phosphate oxidase family protein [Saccharopolyspora sp. 6V]MCA1229212.1 pyridoxamine 5'-phosphate oxidase family protein [Saccharopolyspora sp. 6M]
MSRYARLAFTAAVRAMQVEQGSRPAHRAELGAGVGLEPDPLGERERAFIAARDGCYLASVGETGWPYVQFRGGPPGFVHVLDDRTLGYADVRGNRQYITGGNLRGDPRVALFFMDYATRTRLKLFGRASVRGLDEDPRLTARLGAPRAGGRVERLVLIDVEAHDWNCPKHIPHRYSEADLARTHARLDALEAENAALRARLTARGEPPPR